jgi:inner membrane protein
MVSRTHNLVAFASLLTAAVYYPPNYLSIATLILALVANIIGSLLPDADQASNRLWDLLPGGDGLGKILKNLFLAHRTLSHSILGLYLVYKIIYWLLPKLFNPNFVDYRIVAISLLIGYISHLAADGITEEGLPLLFPLKIKFGFPPIRSWRIKTGKWFEKYVVFPGVLVYLIWIVANNWKLLLGIIALGNKS